MAPPTPLTAAELQQHPEYPHVTWDLKPTAKGRVAVASGRGGPFELAYEVHGRGPIHLVWIMGLGSFKTAWQRQTKDFAHTNGDKYTSLIFDNRGMGESDKPLMRYSTSEMALDITDLLQHLKWTDSRQLHVVGVSMGGMIAQELAMRIPERIASLTLLSTAAAIVNTIGYFENLKNRINMFIPRGIDHQVQRTKFNLYADHWLELPDCAEFTVEPFPTNGDRIAASEVRKRNDPAGFTPRGFMCQAMAAGWHHKSPEQLKEIGDKVGRQRIQVIHGKLDRMITFPHAATLIDGLGGQQSGITTHFPEKAGHVIPAEAREEFFGWMEELIAKVEALNGGK